MDLFLPDEPTPVRLMNTVWADRHGMHDALTSRAELVGWLAATGVAEASTATDNDLHAYRRLRDALRRLAALATGGPASDTDAVDAAVAEINAAAANPAPPRLQRIGASLRRFDDSSVAASRAALAGEAIDLLTGHQPLRACPAPGCVLYFVRDHPRREWCSTGCGNRVRAARHYRRHRGGGVPAG